MTVGRDQWVGISRRTRREVRVYHGWVVPRESRLHPSGKTEWAECWQVGRIYLVSGSHGRGSPGGPVRGTNNPTRVYLFLYSRLTYG